MGPRCTAALGTTIRKARSQEAFAKVDRDYVAAFAALGRAAGADHFGLVSAVGADAASRSFYWRTKGQAEAAVRAAQAQKAAAESNQTALEQKAAGLCAPPLSFTPQSINSTACGEAKAAADAAIQAGDASIDAAQGQLDLLRRGGAPASQVALQAQVASAQALVLFAIILALTIFQFQVVERRVHYQ